MSLSLMQKAHFIFAPNEHLPRFTKTTARVA